MRIPLSVAEDVPISSLSCGHYLWIFFFQKMLTKENRSISNILLLRCKSQVSQKSVVLLSFSYIILKDTFKLYSRQNKS